MIHPTIGRVVLFWPAADEAGKRPDQPFPALIAYVHSEHLINVGGFAHNGQPFAATSVPLLQDDDELAPSSAYAEWMPYQKQAAATSTSELAKHIENVDMRVNALEGWKAEAARAPTETKVYADGTSATGSGALPDQSPAQQDAQQQSSSEPAGASA